jgi:cytochrome c oxidase assembly protein subunit 15
MNAAARRPIAYWLFACCAMVFATLIVGGVTRLTHSGLSIVEWQPLVGTIPPLSEGDWLDLFAKYQLTPEFQQVNLAMTVDEFKFIFWWEWVHRLLGRSIGLVFFLPFLGFLLRGQLDRALWPKLFSFFVLGGLQGAMGWYMVKSGLVDDPRVSQYRLTAHLGLAFLIFGLMLWTALDLLRARVPRPSSPAGLRRFAAALAGLVFFMVLTGGLVAGIHAGLAYNSFPLMNGDFMPEQMWLIEPWWLNLFSNIGTVQFNHRLVAWALIFLIPILWWRGRGANLSPRARLALDVFLAWLAVQVALGITTLLLVVPVALAAAHQAGAMVLFGLSLWVNHELRCEAAEA